MDTRYLMREAAAYFHTGGISGILKHPVDQRAEMMAHILIKQVRDDYIEHQRKQAAASDAERRRKSTSFNPRDAIHRQWML